MAVDVEDRPATVKQAGQAGGRDARRTEVLERLVATLEGERDAISRLLALSEEERQAVAHRHLERLLRVVGRQQQVYVTVTAMEESRRRALKQWAELCGLEGHQPSLEEALPQIGEPHASVIRGLMAAVRERAGLLAAAHRRNRLLVERAFELGDATISFLAQRMVGSDHPSVLDCEA